MGSRGVIDDPRPSCDACVLELTATTERSGCGALFGYYLVACAIQQGALTLGATPLQAFGAGMMVFLLHHLDGLIVQGDYKKLDKRNARLFWVAINSLVGITTLR